MHVRAFCTCVHLHLVFVCAPVSLCTFELLCYLNKTLLNLTQNPPTFLSYLPKFSLELEINYELNFVCTARLMLNKEGSVF